MVVNETFSELPLDLEMELSRCLRCGFCYDLAWLGQYSMCPITKVFGFQSYGAKGQVIIANALLNNQLEWNHAISKRLFACVDCGNCELNCAMAMPLTKIFHAIRTETHNRGYGLNTHKLLAQHVRETGNVYGIDSDDRVALIPQRKNTNEESSTFYFMGCVGSLLRREIIQSTLEIFDKVKLSVNILENESCCGYPLWQEGQEENAKQILEKNILHLKENKAETVVFSCPSCYRMFKEIAPKLLHEAPPFKLVHVTEMLNELLTNGKLKFIKTDDSLLKIAYHDPCELGRHLGIFDAPRNLIKQLPGAELVELPRSQKWSFCCGGAGKLMIPSVPDFNDQISIDRQKEAQAAGVDMIVSACPSCKSNLALYNRPECNPLPVKDLTELINDRLSSNP